MNQILIQTSVCEYKSSKRLLLKSGVCTFCRVCVNERCSFVNYTWATEVRVTLPMISASAISLYMNT